MGLQYTLVGSDDGASVITVFVPGQKPLVAQSDHPNFNKIVEGVVAKDESVVELFDVAATAAQKFERLSDRVTSANGRLYLDGDEINNALATQVVRFVAEGVNDWKPLVNFFENVQSNPNDHSREQLFDWLNAKDFTITDEGNIVGYKGVKSVDGVTFQSTRAGKALVNGEVQTGYISQKVGDVVEMPRGDVAHNPSEACSTGLHVANFDYASGYNQGAILEVHVNPRDVVSVPTDGGGDKVRVCRYTVVGTLDAPYSSALLYDEDEDYYEDGDEWGDGEGDLLDEDIFNEPQDEPQEDSPVQAGDKFQDLDKRRNRIITITQVDGDVAHYEHYNNTGTISVKRLLTPYRFRKV